jgi:hypothetical protein
MGQVLGSKLFWEEVASAEDKDAGENTAIGRTVFGCWQRDQSSLFGLAKRLYERSGRSSWGKNTAIQKRTT